MRGNLPLILFICILGSFYTAFAESFRNIIRWVEVDSDESLSMPKMPVGQDSGHNLFLCRATVENDQVPGKLYIQNDELGCVIAYRGQERTHKLYETLYFFPGSTSWIQFSGGTTIEFVRGGSFGDYYVYICRTIVNGKLIPGMLYAENKTCHVGDGGLEHVETTNIEVLVRNGFGQHYGTDTKIVS